MLNNSLLQKGGRPFALYKTLIIGFGIGLAILTLSRLMLFTWQFERVSDAGNIGYLLLMGVRADIIQMGYLTLPLVLIAPLFLNRWGINYWKTLQSFWLVITLTYVVFMEVSTPAFIMQYDLRPNRLFIEYLAYPKEVFSTLWAGFKPWLILSALAVVICIVGFSKLVKRLQQPTHNGTERFTRALLIWPLLVLCLLLGIRSTLAHRPANPAFFAVTSDALVNDLILSSSYSLEYAIYNMRHEASAARVYGSLPIEDILELVRQSPHLAEKKFPFTQYPTVHFNPASRQFDSPKNIVVILEESLGATFIKDLGGISATPNLEQLRHDGWWFKQLYATGTRSVRGIEAVISSFLPTPARSTVKLSLSQHHFYTAADLLSRQGYFTEFLYGGETHFDNMKSFFTGNGFQSILGQDDVINPQFIGSWGASDEDLFNTAHQRFEELHRKKKPFFSLVFTSSNHEPFEYPDGKIERYSAPKHSVENAVKYADYALGQFIETAKSSNYWDNTIFLIVADHDTRVYGNELVPIKKFQIPGLILGGSVEPRTIDAVTSQIDLLPTIISLAGVSAWTPAIGQDLSQQNASPANRAMMQFGNNYAWLSGNNVTLLTPGKAFTGRYDVINKQLIIDENPDTTPEPNVLAHALLPSWLYQHRAYFVPENK